MGVTVKLPGKKEFIPTTHIFEAEFNNPTVGKYDFGVDANKNNFVLVPEKNSVYYIDRMSIGGNIAESDYNDSIDVSPLLRFKLALGGTTGEFVQPRAIPVMNYIDDKDLSIFFNDDKGNNQLVLDFKGILNQTSNLVGVVKIRVIVSLSIFRITDPTFVKNYQGIYNQDIGQSLRGV